MKTRALLLLSAFCLAGGRALPGQEISNLESARPVTMEDAVPIEIGSYSASADYAYARRVDRVDYAGPAFAVAGGILPGVELGAESRLLTNPRLNARRGIGSGDLDVHLLGALHRESAWAPALALRADAVLATGFASHGTNLVAELIATRSLESFRVHGTAGFVYVGSPREGQRNTPFFATAGADVRPFGSWRTDTIAMADVVVRQSVISGGRLSVGIEVGLKQRVGFRTFFYAGMSSEVAGERDRLRYRGILGLTHAF
jgi:hypothetical protein